MRRDPSTIPPDADQAEPAPRGGRWKIILPLALLAIGLFAAISELATLEPGDEPPIALEGVRDSQRIFGGLRQHRDRIGDPEAPVTMQYFTDMQCGTCRDQFLDTVPDLVDLLVRTGEAQILYRHYSFSRSAIQKGFIAAEAAGEQGYQWHYAYIFFASQEEAERHGLGDELLRSIAVAIPEMDVAQWERDMEEGGGPEGEITESLLRQDEIARGIGLRAQPSVVISGPEETVIMQDSPDLEEILRGVEMSGGGI